MGVSADINVGEILRNVTGIGGIKDGKFKYPMKRCAAYPLTSGISCGVCMPCQDDNDCDAIDIAQVTGDIFGPLGSIVARILLDQVFGPGDKKINMYCSKLVGNYGACIPCSNVLSACGKGKEQGPPATDCKHSVCAAGEALAKSCQGGCAEKVCNEDPYCCTDRWDRTCIQRVERICDPQITCVGEDSCSAKKPDQWYCADSQPFASFRCDANGDKETSRQCPAGQFCHRMIKDAQKSPAVLGTNGEPKCFPARQ
jgi:hypothetical protein